MTSLDDALAHLTERYRARNPQSERQMLAACDVLPAGNTRSVLFHAPFPLTMARGEGCRLWDVDGHAYVDALGEFTAGIYGHTEPRIQAAIVAALQDGLSLSSHTEREAALAREIQRRFPSLELLRFTNSGTEANPSLSTAASSPRSWWSRCWAPAAASRPKPPSCMGCAPCAMNAARCSWSTR